MATLIGMILVKSAVGFVFNHFVMPSPVLNFMLMGMAFSAAFSNMVTEERLEQIMQGFNPILGIAFRVLRKVVRAISRIFLYPLQELHGNFYAKQLFSSAVQS